MNMCHCMSFSSSKHTYLQFSCSRIGGRPSVLSTLRRSYSVWSEQGLVQSAATQRGNTLQLPLSSFPGAAQEEGGERIFSVWVAGAPSACSLPPVLDILCTGETERKLHCLLLLWHCLVCVYVGCCIFYFTLGLFPSTCGASVDWWQEEGLSSAGGALMGGNADSGWDWGCWTEGGRACLSWDSSSSSRGSTRPPSTAFSAACWDWPMCRASPLCPTAYTRWAMGLGTHTHYCLCLFLCLTHSHYLHPPNLLYHVFSGWAS